MARQHSTEASVNQLTVETNQASQSLIINGADQRCQRDLASDDCRWREDELTQVACRRISTVFIGARRLRRVCACIPRTSRQQNGRLAKATGRADRIKYVSYEQRQAFLAAFLNDWLIQSTPSMAVNGGDGRLIRGGHRRLIMPVDCRVSDSPNGHSHSRTET